MADLEPNLHYELEQYSRRSGRRVTFNKEALQRYLKFALSGDAAWAGNFRDLNASVTRMATLAAGGRISREVVDDEILRLSAQWSGNGGDQAGGDLLDLVLGAAAADLDRFDRVQLADVLGVCRDSRSLSEAGRKLFAESLKRKQSANDADRLRKYLARFGLTYRGVSAVLAPSEVFP
jgi:transcriptional regulatory protein RtcR